MNIKRSTIINTNVFEIGDVIDFELIDSEKVQAMAVQQKEKSMIFCFVDCLTKEYCMDENIENVADNYEATTLRKKLNNEIFNRFPTELKTLMIPFDSGVRPVFLLKQNNKVG